MNELEENYLINRYKNSFKAKNGDIYISFKEMKMIEKFDFNLRMLFLKYILLIENDVRKSLSSLFENKYEQDEFLDSKIFNKDIIDKKICSFKNHLNKNAKNIKLTASDFFGLLSFGELITYYGMLNESDRNNIARKYNITSRELILSLSLLRVVRNICAHSNNLFTFKSKMRVSSNMISLYSKVNTNITTTYIVYEIISRLLTNDRENDFNKELLNNIGLLKDRSRLEIFNRVLKYLGIPKNTNYRTTLNWFLDNMIIDNY